MRELSLNILDIVENSTKAKATEVKIKVKVDKIKDVLSISIDDNGVGMNEEFLKNVVDPFTTTRTTRKVGMGIPLFKESCEMTGGSFNISSFEGVGTKVKATFILSSIDRMPLGNLAETMTTLIMGNPQVDFSLEVEEMEQFIFSTKETKDILGETDLTQSYIISYLKEFLQENINLILGERV